MKVILITTFFVILFVNNLFSQTEKFEWVKQIGGTGGDIGYSIAVDLQGNIYTTGVFTGTADFDPSNKTFNLTSVGGKDVFISKLDAGGNFVWAQRIGNLQDDTPNAIAVDGYGNICIAGSVSGINGNSGYFGIFIMKFDSLGNNIWTHQFPTQSYNQQSLTIDKTGNVFITGMFSGDINFSTKT